MALFGALEALPLAEVLSLLSHKEGALEVWNLEGLPPTTLYFRGGRLVAVTHKGKPLPPLDAKSAVQSLLLAKKGNFEFIPGAKPPGGEPLNIPIEKILLFTVAQEDELARYRPYLPHPEARFRIVGNAPEDESLKEFFHQALPLLKRGASPREVAQALRAHEDLIRLKFYKLQQAGTLERARADERSSPPVGVAQRLLSFLRTVWNR
jgi:hypothetical protein